VSPLYGQAAARYGLDPRVLRALHQVESTTAFRGCLANRQDSGAIGPFQFKPATFRQYAVDADGDGQPNICGFADALFTAARYLQALGADARADSARTYRALVRYGTHAPRVVAHATRLVR
jgi:membrane-bound lytic murein transglycosylase B